MEKMNMESLAEICEIPIYENILVVDNLRAAYAPSSPHKLVVDGFIIAIILEGNAKIIVDDVEYSLERGDIFGCNPRNILEKSMLSIDLKILGIFVSPEYVAKLLSTITIDWSFLIMASTHEVLHANDEEITHLVAYIELLRKRLAAENTKHKEESIQLLIQSMGLEIFDIKQRQGTPTRETTYSAGENLVQRFLLMLTESSQHGKPYLNVNGYAERLNVTSKYFSFVCKNILGKSASEIIKEDIMRTANVLLHDNSLSIKQISDRLGFANQSHFGTFVRRHSGGKSPQELRNNKNL